MAAAPHPGGLDGTTVVRRRWIDLQAVYVMWVRDMLRTARAPSRIVGSLVMPLLFLGFLGMGLRGTAFGVTPDGDYLTYLAPGMIGMTLLMGSVFSGLHVLWDRQFGFLREIMVTPVSRLSIVLGRLAGGMTLALLQGLMVAVGATILGVDLLVSPLALLQALAAMLLISASFVSLGVVFASVLDDFQGFSLIMNFVVFPVFFLSGAMFPVDNLPGWAQPICYADPLLYGVDLLRGALIDAGTLSPLLSFGVLGGFCAAMITAASVMFARIEVT